MRVLPPLSSLVQSSLIRKPFTKTALASSIAALFCVPALAVADDYVISGTEEAPIQTNGAPINFQNTAPDINEPIHVSYVDIVKPASAYSSVVIFNAVQHQDLRFQSATVEHADILYTSSFAANVAGIQVSNGIHDFYTDFLTVNDIAIDLGGTGRANAAGILIQSSTAGQKLEHLKVSGVSTTAGGSGGTTSGIRFEVAGLDTALIDVSDVSSDNIGAYGIYNLESTLSSDAVVLSSISSSNATAYGYYAVNNVWNDADLDTASLRVSDVTGAQYAYGVRLNDTDTTADDKYDQKDHVVSLNATESVVVTGVRVDENSAKAAGAYGVHHKGSDLSTGLLYVSDVSGVQYDGGPAAAGFWSLGQTSADAVVIRNVYAKDGQAYGILSNSTAGLQSGLITVENISASAEAFGYTVGQNTQSDFVSVLNVHSTGSDATGIRILKATLDADTVAAVNVQADGGEAKGVFVDGRNSVLGTTSFITVAGISGSGSAWGLHHTNTSANFVNTDGIFVQDVSSTGGTAYGLHLLNAGTTAHDVSVQKISGKTAYGIYATQTFSADGTLFIGDISGATTARGLYTTKDSTLGSLTVSNVSVSEAWGTANGVWHSNATSVSYSGDVVASDVSGTLNAYGIRTTNVESANLAAALTIAGVEAQNAYGLSAENGYLKISGTTTVVSVLGTDNASAISVEKGTAELADVVIAEVDAAKMSSLVSATDNASVSIASGVIRSASLDAPLAYEGNFDLDADAEDNSITRFALRSVGGSSVSMGGESGGQLTIVGDIVAGRGTQSAADAQAGHIQINAAEGSRIYGDVYAGNGGEVTMSLAGSVLEGQIDDYHELASAAAESEVFRNAAFIDDDGKAIDVTQAGSVNLTLADASTWIARGQSFVSTVSFGQNGGTIDLTKNDNSSVSIGNLSGSGTFNMKLGAYTEGGTEAVKSDMLYIQNVGAGSSFTINATLGDGVNVSDLEGLRFATVGSVEDGHSTELFKFVEIKDQGFNDWKLSVAKEDYTTDDADNVRFNGESNGEGVYKPGEDVVDAIYGETTSETTTLAEGEKSQNYFIGSVEKTDGGGEDNPPSEPTISDAGQAIIATARGLYYNAIEIDRFNQRYGDRRYDENNKSLWARVRHDRWGTDAGVGDFKSQNTTYQMGFDYTKPNEDGKMIYGFAVDLMDGNTDYESIDGSGETKRYAVSAYATYMGDNGGYLDVVGKVGRLSNEYAVKLDSGAGVSADYMNWMAGISVEAGHQLTSSDSRWFAEPQIQAQYVFVSDNDYTNGQTKIEQDNIHSFITRAGFRAGRWLGEGKNANVYFKTDVLHEWAGRQDIHVSDNTTAVKGDTFSINNHGTWFDVGFGFQAPMGKSFYAYGDAEYRFGNNLYQTWTFNLGGKYVF